MAELPAPKGQGQYNNSKQYASFNNNNIQNIEYICGYILNRDIIGFDANSINISYISNEEYNELIEDNTRYINNSLRKHLKNIKNEIENYLTKWDTYRKYINTYEFISSSVSLPKYNIQSQVCSYKPISRSFFKMVEMINNFNIYIDDTTKPIKSFHLAEGPGGFIEALNFIRKNPNDRYYGMTLNEQQNGEANNNYQHIPNWDKIRKYRTKFPYNNIILDYGPNNDGNLYSNYNLQYIRDTYANQIDFITADGGFDYSQNYAEQERDSINLIFCEILYALIMSKRNGNFIIKMFDLFHKTSVEMLYLLSYFYREVYIYKPLTSRLANSEKYIVCLGFQNVANRWDIVDRLTDNFDLIETGNVSMDKIFDFNINSRFENRLNEINSIYGQQQLENIINTINLINEKYPVLDDKVDKYKIKNTIKCIRWCKKYNLPYYNMFNKIHNG